MRYLWLLPALFLDFIQGMFALAFFVLAFATPVGGGATGAAAGAYLCWNLSGGIVSGIINGLTCAAGGGLIGAAASAYSVPIGLAVDTVLSIAIGGALLIALAYNGLLYFDIVLPAFLAEVTPLLGFLPFWTAMTFACIRRKAKEEKAGATVSDSWNFVTAAKGAGGLADHAALLAQKRYAPVTKRVSSDIRVAAKGAVLALLICVGGSAHAQTVPDPVQYVITPETPAPGDVVLLEVQGVGSFLGDATITWTQDGKTVKSGAGERTYAFTAPALGTRTTVRVSISSSQGSFSKQWTISPSLVNLVWEADTTMPPLSRGKALYSAGSDLTVVAYPSIYSGSSRIAQSALSYQWYYGDEPVPSASGLGRSIFSFTGDQLQVVESVSVDIYYGAAKVGHGEIVIPAVTPRIALYARDALRGVLYDSTIPSAISLLGSEVTIQAEPLYFSSAAKKTNQLSYAWTLNGEEVAGPDSARGILTLRQSGGGEGSATLGVALQNYDSSQFVQSAQAALQLVFGQQTGNAVLNFFGL